MDPFDLNVFSPYISSNLNKHLQRCGVSSYPLVTLLEASVAKCFLPLRSAFDSQLELHNLTPHGKRV